jgi:polyisoprenoid-binding protein YceI
MRAILLSLFTLLLFASASPAYAPADVPVFEIKPVDSSIRFSVKSSVSIAGKFDKWDATFVLQSPDVTTGVLDIKIQADSVDTGSGMKNGKLKSKDFFDVANSPAITFHSTKIVRLSHSDFEVDGDFTIRGVSNPEKLKLVLYHKGGSIGDIEGKMVFNRKDYGMNGGIPFIKIADHVEVKFNLKIEHVSGPPTNLNLPMNPA